MSTYNGWTNYATWRVNLEFFDGYDPDGEAVMADELESMVYDHIDETSSGLARDMAQAFIADVNWQEIAENINDAYGLTEAEESDHA